MTKYAERLKEIEAAKEVLRGKIESATAENIGALEAETRALADEEKEIRTKMELATTLAPNSVNASSQRSADQREMRAAEFVKSGKMQVRALLGTGKIAKPSKAGGVNEGAPATTGLVDDVNAIPMTGNGTWIVGYEKTKASAADVTDGNKVGGTEATYDYVEISPSEWGVFSQISNQVKKMTSVDYMTAVENASLEALRTKAEGKIIAAVIASDLAETKNSVALDATFIRKLVTGFRPVKGKGGVELVITQADMATLGAVRGTNEKKAIYDITYNEDMLSGIIQDGGTAVKFRISDNITTGTQLFGQFGAVDMPMWDDYAIETNEGGEFFEKNQIAVRGLQTANADLVAYHAIQIIKQAAAGNGTSQS